jgi:hypothetical protein
MIGPAHFFAATLMPAAFLTVGTPVHGDPIAMTRGLSVRFTPMPARTGIKMPIELTTATAQTAHSVRRHLHLTPPIPVSIYRRHNLHFVVMPRSAWPSQCRITVTWTPTGTSVQFSTDDDRSIQINLSTQHLIAQRHGETVRTMAVSTGVAPAWATPQGTFWVYKKVRDDHMVGGSPNGPDHWDVQHVPYAQYFTGGVAIHGAWWNHQFGRPASHGCVQVPTAEGPHGPTGEPPDAQWLWHFTDIGTPVIVKGQTPMMGVTRASLPQRSRP